MDQLHHAILATFNGDYPQSLGDIAASLGVVGVSEDDHDRFVVELQAAVNELVDSNQVQAVSLSPGLFVRLDRCTVAG